MKMLATVAILLVCCQTALACRGLDFNLQTCGKPGEKYGVMEGTCFQGNLSVSGPFGSFTWASTAVSCKTPLGCMWLCYKDTTCQSAPVDCAGTTAFSCDCHDFNFLWNITFGGNKVIGWQGDYSSGAAYPPLAVAPLASSVTVDNSTRS